MKHTTPFFYSSFACTASNCSDSCCIGWEIDIDQKTASYYHILSQKEDFPFGKRLKEEISYEDISSFKRFPKGKRLKEEISYEDIPHFIGYFFF